MSIQASPSFSSIEVGIKPLLQSDGYLAQLLGQRQVLSTQALGPMIAPWLEQLRDRAAHQVRQLTLPTNRDEEWRFTDLSPLEQVSFQPPEPNTALAASDIATIAALTLPEAEHSRLVFVNGIYVRDLSAVAHLPAGLFVGPLAQLPLEYRDQLREYLDYQQGEDLSGWNPSPGTIRDVFTTLNTAGFLDAAVVWVPKNQVVKPPIHLLFVSTASETSIISQPRSLVVAEASSASTLVEDYVGVGEGVYFTNTVTELWVKENAQINHTRLQRDSRVAFHVGRTAIAQARDSRYTCNAISVGAKLSRHNLNVTLTGEQTETVLNGLTLATDTQLADTHSAIAFTQPHGTSRQLHKCIVNDRAHAVFNGKVFVPKAAQLTDAGQLNRNLLLSPKARVDTKPQLEIVADNVKCTHGATVGQLDTEEVFYLQSRGLDLASARNLLVQAFAAEVIDQVPVASLGKSLSRSVQA